MKNRYLGCALLAAPFAFWACSAETLIDPNEIEKIRAAAEADSDTESEDSSSSESDEVRSSSSSAKLSSSSSKDSESSVVYAIGDLPTCSSKREGMTVYVESKNVYYTCTDEFWLVASASSNEETLLPASSSSSVKVVTTDGLGTCAPQKSPIVKGESVRWTFSPNTATNYSPIDFAKGSYKWSFSGDAILDRDALGVTSATVTYPTSGLRNASVVVTMEDGFTESVSCSPLQVNGESIKGCSCMPDQSSPDVATGSANVTWTVTGCVSSSMITGYKWTGATGSGSTATAVFAAKGEEITPVVSVLNDDNTVQEFTCGSAKAIDSSMPEFVFEQNEWVNLPAGISFATMSSTAVQGCEIFCEQHEYKDVNMTFNGRDVSCSSGCYFFSLSPSPSECEGVIQIETSEEVSCHASWW